jgi:PAS domain-containing protein
VSSRRRDRVVTLAALALVLAAVLGRFITGSITQPIAVLRDAADRLGAARSHGPRREAFVGRPRHARRISNGMVELGATTTSRPYVDGIIRSMGEIILVINLRGRVRTANRSATAIVEA